MSLFALDSLWTDVYTAGGFWVGVLGLVVGVAGFWIAIVQIRETRKTAEAGQKAAEAARDAANKTLAESKEAYERFVAAHAGRMLSELQTAASDANWQIAALRARDLAEILATLPGTADPPGDAEITEAVKQLREFGHTFDGFAEKKAKRLSPAVAKAQWKPLLQTINARLDSLRAPFRGPNSGQRATDDQTDTAPPDRGEPPDEDESRSGKLDPEGEFR